MFELSIWKLVLVALVVLVLFGRGKVADFMGEFGKGIKSFKQGMNEDHGASPVAPPPAQLTAQAPAANVPVAAAPAVTAPPVGVPVQPTPNGEPVPEHQGQR